MQLHMKIDTARRRGRNRLHLSLISILQNFSHARVRVSMLMFRIVSIGFRRGQKYESPSRAEKGTCTCAGGMEWKFTRQLGEIELLAAIQIVILPATSWRKPRGHREAGYFELGIATLAAAEQCSRKDTAAPPAKKQL